MNPAPTPMILQNLTRIFSLARLRYTLGVSFILALLMMSAWQSSFSGLLLRAFGTGLSGLFAFGIIERWPKHLPAWLARWVLQLIAVALAIPIFLCSIYYFSTMPGQPAFWQDSGRFTGFRTLCLLGLLFAPWVALAALVRQKEAIAKHQALAFDLERSELERQALDARYRLLQAQIEPHFLFNTLANVRALVNTGSPQAPQVLDSLIAYLRAAVPRINGPMPNMAQELQLTRAYLDLMQLRMPDRLQFTIRVDTNKMSDEMNEASVYCPAMCLLTLVENAVRHGIDPSEDGGRIDIDVNLNHEHCVIVVTDTGIGIQHQENSLGTGLAALRERLQLIFADAAQLEITAVVPHGVSAKIVFPIRTEKA